MRYRQAETTFKWFLQRNYFGLQRWCPANLQDIIRTALETHHSFTQDLVNLSSATMKYCYKITKDHCGTKGGTAGDGLLWTWCFASCRRKTWPVFLTCILGSRLATDGTYCKQHLKSGNLCNAMADRQRILQIKMLFKAPSLGERRYRILGIHPRCEITSDLPIESCWFGSLWRARWGRGCSGHNWEVFPSFSVFPSSDPVLWDVVRLYDISQYFATNLSLLERYIWCLRANTSHTSLQSTWIQHSVRNILKYRHQLCNGTELGISR